MVMTSQRYRLYMVLSKELGFFSTCWNICFYKHVMFSISAFLNNVLYFYFLKIVHLKKKKIIAFVAKNINGIVIPENNFHIIFDHTIMNLGNNYNSGNEICIAPISGMYHFAVEIKPPLQSTTTHCLHNCIM